MKTDKSIFVAIKELTTLLKGITRSEITEKDYLIFEDRIVKLIKKHAKIQFENVIEYMRKNNIHLQLEKQAETWQRQQVFKSISTPIPQAEESFGGITVEQAVKGLQQINKLMPKIKWYNYYYCELEPVIKSLADEQAFMMTSSLFKEDMENYPDKWWEMDDFQREYTKIEEDIWGYAAGKSFSHLGIFINFEMRDPQVLDQLGKRWNYIKGLPQDNFHRMKEILTDMYFNQGMHPNEVAKEFKFQKLWDEYYKNRSVAIARTETMVITSEARDYNAQNKGMQFKEWLTAHDDRVRDAHVLNEEAGSISIDKLFPSGQRYPGDGNDPALIVYCRCVVIYTSGRVKKSLKFSEIENARQVVIEHYFKSTDTFQKFSILKSVLINFLVQSNLNILFDETSTSKAFYSNPKKLLYIGAKADFLTIELLTAIIKIIFIALEIDGGKINYDTALYLLSKKYEFGFPEPTYSEKANIEANRAIYYLENV